MQRATEPPNLLASSGSRSCGRLMDVRILLRIEELVNPAILRGEHARGTGSAPQVEPCVFCGTPSSGIEDPKPANQTEAMCSTPSPSLEP